MMHGEYQMNYFLIIILCFLSGSLCQTTKSPRTSLPTPPSPPSTPPPLPSTTRLEDVLPLEIPIAIINITFPTIQNHNPLSTKQPSQNGTSFGQDKALPSLSGEAVNSQARNNGSVQNQNQASEQNNPILNRNEANNANGQPQKPGASLKNGFGEQNSNINGQIQPVRVNNNFATNNSKPASNNLAQSSNQNYFQGVQNSKTKSQSQNVKTFSEQNTPLSNFMKTPTDPNIVLPKGNSLIKQKLPQLKQNRTSSRLTNQETSQKGLLPNKSKPLGSQQNQEAALIENQTQLQDTTGVLNHPVKKTPISPIAGSINDQSTANQVTPTTQIQTKSNQSSPIQSLLPQTSISPQNLDQSKTPTFAQNQPTATRNETSKFSKQQPLTSSNEQLPAFPEQNQKYSTRNKTSTVSVTSRNKNNNQPPAIAFSSSSNQPDLQTKGEIECYNASDGTIKCRNKMPQPHVSTSQFKGDIGIKASGLNGTKVLGGESTNKMNETMNFKAGRSNYDYQNLTSLHNCSGCLENKELIHINTSSPLKPNKTKSQFNTETQAPQTQSPKQGQKYPHNNLSSHNITKASTKFAQNYENRTKTNQKVPLESELSEISKLRNKLLSSSTNRTNFLTKNISRPTLSNQTTNAPILNPKTSHLNLNTSTRGRIESQTPLQRRCEEIDTRRNKIGNTGKANIGVVLSCVTKRRLVAANHKTKTTKKNGKVVDEPGKPSNNTERARQNEENAKSNDERKHQSDKNNEANNKQSLSNDKILQQILRGEHGKPVTSYAHDENADRNFENQTIKLDPSIIQGRMPMDDKVPDPERLDEDNSVMGIDENPAIETKLNETSSNNKTTSKHPSETENMSTDENREHEIKPKIADHNLSNHNKTTISHNQTKPHSQNGTNMTKLDSNIGQNHAKLGKEIGKNVTKMESDLLPDKTNATDVGSALSTNTTVFNKKKTKKTDDRKSDDDEDKKVEKPKKRILAFGDSLTKGTYSKNGSVHPYSRHLVELLKDSDPNTNYEIFTEGVNGECACQGMVHRLPSELEDHKKIDLVIIIAGTNDLLKNDCLRDCDLFEAIKRLHEIAHRKKAKSILTTILESTFTPKKLTSQEYRDVLSDVNQNIRGYADYRDVKDKVKLCDIADEFPRKAPPLIDRIHPSPEGYDILAEILFRCIKEFKY
ncbi:GATA zinc finger domain-containing protein 14-like [Clytia hemisphaerica]|uniref:SGNH hydrolase-type esterase domain-containing protein n=1 Tax=Clytia hemisphaerica TaxID=252671 RepID=A0A7M6DM85_9CNID